MSYPIQKVTYPGYGFTYGYNFGVLSGALEDVTSYPVDNYVAGPNLFYPSQPPGSGDTVFIMGDVADDVPYTVTGGGSVQALIVGGAVLQGTYQAQILNIGGGDGIDAESLTLPSGGSLTVTAFSEIGSDGVPGAVVSAPGQASEFAPGELDIAGGSFITTAEFDAYTKAVISLSSGSFAGEYVVNEGTIIATGGTLTSSDSIDNNGTITLSGGTSFSVAGALVIADQANGTFDASGGSTVDIGTYVTVGSNGNAGEVTIDNAGWTQSAGDLDIGDGGTGAVTMTNGASVQVDGGVYVGGGDGGSGTLTIQGGATVFVTGDYGIRVAPDPGSTGTLLVTGANTELFAGDASVTNSSEFGITTDGGAGTITISNGALAETEFFFIASAASGNGGSGVGQILSGATVESGSGGVGGQGGTGTLTVDAARWLVAGNITIGYDGGPSQSGSGTLIIQDGGTVTDQTGDVGTLPATGGFVETGTVTVGGAGSTWSNAGDLYLGDGAEGTLSIASGGSVTVGGLADIGVAAGVTGLLALTTQSTTLSAGSDVIVGDAGGALVALTGQLSAGGDLTIAAQANSSGIVSMTQTGSLAVTGLLTVGEGGLGSLDSSGSITAMNDLYVGELLTGNGAVTLRAGSTTAISGELSIANGGSGVVTDSGVVTTTQDVTVGGGFPPAANPVGTLSVGGTGSVIVGGALDVGASSGGVATISGLVRAANGDVTIGDAATVTGSIDVASGGSLISGGTVYVGQAGTGTLLVSKNGLLAASAIVVANQSGSSGSVELDSLSTELDLQGITTGAGNFNIIVSDSAINLSADLDVSSIAGANGTARITGAQSVVHVQGNIYVANGGSGDLEIENGASVRLDPQIGQGQTSPRNVFIGQGQGSTGRIDISDGSLLGQIADGTNGGSGSVMVGTQGQLDTSSGASTIGGSGGNGLIQILGQWISALVEVATDPARGTVEVQGDTASWTDSGDAVIGEEGVGSLSISGGGSVDIAGNLTAGESADASGVITIDAATLTTGADFVIGEAGSGTLDLSDGGSLSVGGALTVADGQGSTGSVSLGDGTVTVAGDLTIGNAGSGTLDLSTDLAASGAVTLGVSGDGMMTVEAGGMLSVASTFIIGGEGTGSLDVLGFVSADEVVYVGNDGDGAGTLTIDGGTLDAAAAVDIGNYGSGELSVLDGGLLLATTLSLAAAQGGSGAASVVSGTADLSDNLFVEYGGTLDIGSAGAVVVAGYSFVGAPGNILAEPGPQTTATVDLTDGGLLSVADSFNSGPNAFINLDAQSEVTVGQIVGSAGVFSVANGAAAAGAGTISANVLDDGAIYATGGTLSLVAPTSITGAGTIDVLADGSASIRAGDTITIGTLALEGSLALGDTPIEVTQSYVNANWGSGNSFDATANVVSGDIFGADSGLTAQLGAGSFVVSSGGGAVNTAPITATLTLTPDGSGLYEGTFRFSDSGATALTVAVQTTGLTSAAITGISPGNVTLDSGQSDQAFNVVYDPEAGPLEGSVLLVTDFENVAPIQISFAEAVTCFAAGTRIATPAGAVAIEELREGDRVLTLDGRHEPIVWIGRRRLRPARHCAPARAHPIRISASAFAAGLPARDLLVSPEHAIFAAGVLIPARCLVNGTSVVQIEVEEIVYFHIELARHEVVFAEGLPAESWLDTGSRRAFDNAPVVSLHEPFEPDAAARAWAHEARHPLVEAGPLLEHVRATLIARAASLQVAAYEIAIDIDAAGFAETVVPAGAGRVLIRSRAGGAVGGDVRALGCAIADVSLDDVRVEMTDACFTRGFHAVEREADRAWRWTDGAGVLALGPAAMPRLLQFHAVAVADFARAA